VEQLALRGDEVLVDAYCGIGTFTLPLAQRVRQALGLEVQAASVEQAQLNAQLNAIANVTFQDRDRRDIAASTGDRTGCGLT
jgi:23S rRNA (uracil1939-C5)-methyltransferase